MYIITNTTATGEYTPSKANTLEEAKAWLLECTAYNIRAWQGDELPSVDMTDEEVIEWAKDNLVESEFKFTEDSSYIEYDDGSYNRMQIYNLDEI